MLMIDNNTLHQDNISAAPTGHCPIADCPKIPKDTGTVDGDCN